MEYRPLGRTGLRVSRLSLGCMTFGDTTGEEEAARIVARYVEAGGNFLDTANVYAKGGSEEITGRAIKPFHRERLVIATKAVFPMGEGVNQRGANRKNLSWQVEECLRRLGTDYIDLFQTHGFDPRTPPEETLRTLDALVRAGKVRYLGASNYTGWQLMKSLGVSERLGLERFECLQARYSLISRGAELELLPLCRAEGVSFTCWSPLQKGWLAGRTKDVEQPEGKRLGDWTVGLERYVTERSVRIAEKVGEVARKAGKSPAQVSLAWLLAQNGVTSPVIGARTLAQLEDNLGAAGLSLAPEDVQALNLASSFEIDYPYEFQLRRTPSLLGGKH